MWDALHKQTFKETQDDHLAGYRADQIWDKFSNPYSEEWICCPICQKPVTPVKSHWKMDNTVFVPSFFRVKDGYGGCISGESDEHKKFKILIANLIENDKVVLKIGKSIIPYNNLQFKEIPRVPFRWEQQRGNRRADVLFEFKEWHIVLGQGIVFEIQLSSISTNDILNRENDWVENGYSLAWLKPDHFTEESLINNEIWINAPWSTHLCKITKENVDSLKNLLFQTKRELEVFEYRKTHTCRTCLFGSPSKYNTELIACWYHTHWGHGVGTRNKPTNHEPLDTCPSYKSPDNKIEVSKHD